MHSDNVLALKTVHADTFILLCIVKLVRYIEVRLITEVVNIIAPTHGE